MPKDNLPLPCKKCGYAKRWWIHKQKDGATKRKAVCDNCAKAKSLAWYRALNKEQLKVRNEIAKERYRQKPEACLFRIIKNRKNRKGHKQHSFNYMTFQEFLNEIGGGIPKICPVLGISLKMSIGYPTDNSPSVDRIDNTRPYEKGNIAIISRRANFIKRDGTAEEHRKIADWMDQMSTK